MPTATQPGTTPTSAPHVSRFIGTRDLIPNPACPTCGSKRTVKKGKRHNRMRTLQVYECVECLHRFTSGDAGKNKTYPLKIILEAVSTFNLGYSMTETQRQLRRRFHVDVPERSISSWISEHRPLVTYRRLRDTAKKLFSPERLLRTVEPAGVSVSSAPGEAGVAAQLRPTPGTNRLLRVRGESIPARALSGEPTAVLDISNRAAPAGGTQGAQQAASSDGKEILRYRDSCSWARLPKLFRCENPADEHHFTARHHVFRRQLRSRRNGRHP